MGDRAHLIEIDGEYPEVLAVHRALVGDRQVGVVDLVPAARTVLVTFDPSVLAPAAVADWITHVVSDAGPRSDGETEPAPAVIEVPVHYDGDDLDEVAALTGLSPAQVVEAHTASVWTVAFTGFAPGFAYLVGGDPRLQVPRRATPRAAVPAGAVGLAGPYSGVYPRSSPGGWQLIGHTERTIWDVQVDPPALLRPGLRVQFVAEGVR